MLIAKLPRRQTKRMDQFELASSDEIVGRAAKNQKGCTAVVLILQPVPRLIGDGIQGPRLDLRRAERLLDGLAPLSSKHDDITAAVVAERGEISVFDDDQPFSTAGFVLSQS